jgi:hypothetical protein
MDIDFFLDMIQQEVADFDAISLAEMDKVKLMDRVDVKYLIPLSLLPPLLKEAKEHYRVVEINNERICTYETQYFDVEEQLSLYRAHHAGILNRYKVRSRHYVGSNLQFFEVKFKNNKGRTQKKRIRTNTFANPTLAAQEGDFLTTISPLNPSELVGVLWVIYKRITLVSNYNLERLTLDLSLTFRQGENQKAFPQLVIAEVKQEKMGSSNFVDLMKKHHIQQGAISKYCFGIISLYEHVKHNKFKPHLLKVTKIIRQHDAITTIN